MMCQGYFRHNEGYTPKWKDMDKFKGQIVHTEEWPENLDYKNKSIILIGSGATAATTVPAMASKANHVTMLQRSPTFYRTSTVGTEELVERLNKFSDDEKWTYGIVRQQILINQEIFIRRCIEEPEVVKEELINEVRKILGPDYDIEKHFTPSYRPWQQRITLTSNGDLFKSIASGKVSVFTEEIDKAVSNSSLVTTDVWVSMGKEKEKDEREKSFKEFKVTPKIMDLAKKDAIFLHCLPAIRGQEISPDMLEDERSRVWSQARNRLFVQKSLLLHLLNCQHVFSTTSKHH